MGWFIYRQGYQRGPAYTRHWGVNRTPSRFWREHRPANPWISDVKPLDW